MPAATTFHCPENFTIIQRIIPLLVAAVIVAATVELIRRRKLREEFAVCVVESPDHLARELEVR